MSDKVNIKTLNGHPLEDETARKAAENNAAVINRLSEEIEQLKSDDPNAETVTTTYTQEELVSNGTNHLINLQGGTDLTASFTVSTWILLNAGDTVEYNLALYPTACGVAFYNANKEFISGIVGETTPDKPSDIIVGKATVPENTVYMRFCMRTNKEEFVGQYVTTIVAKNANGAKKHYLQDELYGKILTATGDSITAATSSVPGNGYVEQIAARHSMQVENKAIWGAVFASGLTNEDGTPVFSILDTIATMRDDADYIILSGGINDAFKINDGTMQLGEIALYYNNTHDTKTFCGAFEEILKQSLLKWPGKKILFVIEHRMNTGYGDGVGKLFHETVYPKMKEMLHHWGVPYVDLYHDMPSLAFIPEYRDLYTYDADGDGVGDGWHPNAEGYRLLYVPRVEAGMRRI